MTANGLGWLGLAAGLWAAVARAQDAPEPVVLTVMGTNYTARELGAGTDGDPEKMAWRAFSQIQGGIMGAFVEKLECQPSEEDLKDYCRRSAPTPAEMDATFDNPHPTTLGAEEIVESFWQDWQRDADDPDGPKQLAAGRLKDWKINRALFARYGGRVWVGTDRVPAAYDALRALLAEREAAGDFTIHDERLRARYGEFLRLPPPGPLVSEAEGRAALAEHPADRQKRQANQGLKDYLRQKKSE